MIRLYRQLDSSGKVRTLNISEMVEMWSSTLQWYKAILHLLTHPSSHNFFAFKLYVSMSIINKDKITNKLLNKHIKIQENNIQNTHR